MSEANVQATKRCSKCRGEKAHTEFFRTPSTRDGRNTICKACTRAKRRAQLTARGGVPKDIPLAERFHARVAVGTPGECWPWTGRRNAKGYGGFDDVKGSLVAHRVAYALANGAIPDGASVLHKCDNPPCCNPAHLYVGDAAQNAADKVARNRQQRLRGTDNGRHVLTVASVLDIRQRCAGGESRIAVAERYGITPAMVGRVVRRQNWAHVP